MLEETNRLFIALPLPGEIQAALGDIICRLQKGCGFSHCRPSWVKIQNIHLTLCFFGKRPADQVQSICDRLRKNLVASEDTRLEIKNLGVFPNWKKPRILWAGVRDRGSRLEHLKNTVEQSMASFGHVPEKRAFRPHLTLARIKSLKDVRVLEQQVKNSSPCSFGTMQANTLNLYRYVLESTGAVYTVLESFPLVHGTGDRVKAHE